MNGEDTLTTEEKDLQLFKEVKKEDVHNIHFPESHTFSRMRREGSITGRGTEDELLIHIISIKMSTKLKNSIKY